MGFLASHGFARLARAVDGLPRTPIAHHARVWQCLVRARVLPAIIEWQPCRAVHPEPPAVSSVACLHVAGLCCSGPARLDMSSVQCPICRGGIFHIAPISTHLLQGIVRGNHTPAILPKQIMGPTSHQGGICSTSQNNVLHPSPCKRSIKGKRYCMDYYRQTSRQKEEKLLSKSVPYVSDQLAFAPPLPCFALGTRSSAGRCKCHFVQCGNAGNPWRFNLFWIPWQRILAWADLI